MAEFTNRIRNPSCILGYAECGSVHGRSLASSIRWQIGLVGSNDRRSTYGKNLSCRREQSEFYNVLFCFLDSLGHSPRLKVRKPSLRLPILPLECNMSRRSAP